MNKPKSDYLVTMTEIQAGDWRSFEAELKKVRDSLGLRKSSLLFRGQSNSSWKLQTTLERAGYFGMSFRDYYRLLVTVGPAVGTFVGMDVPIYSEAVDESFNDVELFSLRRFPKLDLYSYMVYLRHHGFPSPLMDWSQSAYVAAFFAFRDAKPETEKVSIYAYCEMPQGSKGGAVGEASIHPLGSYIKSHRRHFRQQSDYTICGRFEKGTWEFYPHEPVFGSRGRDVLWKFSLPAKLRVEVLGLLNQYNLNAFSLFDSEEALLETMWFRLRVLRDFAIPTELVSKFGDHSNKGTVHK